MSEKHRHLEPPRDAKDLDMLNSVGADESLYMLFGLVCGRVAGIGVCSYLTPAETISLLEQALRIMRGQEDEEL